MVQATAPSAASASRPSALLALTCSAREMNPFLMASWWEPEKEV